MKTERPYVTGGTPTLASNSVAHLSVPDACRGHYFPELLRQIRNAPSSQRGEKKLIVALWRF